MYASDKSGLSDPYIYLSFGRYSSRSRVVKESVCPTWDQTLLVNQVRIFGNPGSVLESPPPVVMEFFDKDMIVRKWVKGPCGEGKWVKGPCGEDEWVKGPFRELKRTKGPGKLCRW